MHLEPVTLETLEEHVYELFVDRMVNERDLGMIQKGDHVTVTVDGSDYGITQSISMLNTESSSTGAVAWCVSQHFAEWVLTCSKVSSWLTKDQTVVELGCGVSGLVASALGPKVSRYIATDQDHILKLCRQNINENMPAGNKTKKPDIQVQEYDWEYAQQMVGSLAIDNASGIIIACDTIYNDYLIPYFVTALKLVASKMDNPRILIAQQLRSEEVLEKVLAQLLQAGFQMWNFQQELLSPELYHGYVVHYLSLQND